MGRYEMIVAIVAIVMFAQVLRARYSSLHRRDRTDGHDPADSAENHRLREEVKELRERVKVLERIMVEKENSLSREIDALREERIPAGERAQ